MYNYEYAMHDDILQYISDEYSAEQIAELLQDRDSWEEQLNDDLWVCDSVTGNASGSYTVNIWKAEENLCHNMDLLLDACAEWCQDVGEAIEKGAEYCDVTIRCYLLRQMIAEVLDELEEAQKDGATQ